MNGRRESPDNGPSVAYDQTARPAVSVGRTSRSRLIPWHLADRTQDLSRRLVIAHKRMS